MTELEVKNIIDLQRKYFYTGATLDINFRIQALQKLKDCIIRHEDKINDALKSDLGKSAFEGYMCEIGIVLSELTYMIKHTRSFAKNQKVKTPIAQFHSKSYKKPSPYGVTLIMSPWNYPFMLTLDPLVDAIAAGNTAVIKPSAYSPRTSEVIKMIIEECFEEKYVAVILGGRAENQFLLNEHFDYIFFTGSIGVGKEVMRQASSHLTPVTLELGGKSPCIVEKTANIKLAAKRIVFGKYLNCGQTCVAPDYVYCDKSIKDELVEEIKKQVRKQYGKHPLKRENYGKIVNEKHFDRVSGLIESSKVVAGGNINRVTLQIEPTVMDNVSFDDPVMQEEIFGPIMPILTFDTLQEAVTKINSMPHPLAFYIFTNNPKAAEYATSRCGFGGGCINDVIIHLATSEMGFGGFGESGMGSYHGKTGFDTFTHYKSIVDKKTWIDLPMRYQPYKKINEKLLRMFLK